MKGNLTFLNFKFFVEEINLIKLNFFIFFNFLLKVFTAPKIQRTMDRRKAK
jgi:F0F1-type ATP synthase membrane subunit b/b'